MPAVEDLILENNDRLPQPVLGDVGPKLGKGGIGHCREHGRERMLRQGSITHCPPSSTASGWCWQTRSTTALEWPVCATGFRSEQNSSSRDARKVSRFSRGGCRVVAGGAVLSEPALRRAQPSPASVPPASAPGPLRFGVISHRPRSWSCRLAAPRDRRLRPTADNERAGRCGRTECRFLQPDPSATWSE